MSKINKVNDVATEQKKQKDIEDVIESIIKDPIPNNDYWWEEDIFSKTDTQPTTDATKIIVDDIKQTTNNVLKDIDIQAISDNILRNLRPVDDRTAQEQAEDAFISIDNRTQQELEDDDFLSNASDNESEIEVDTPPDSEIEVDMVEPELIDTTSAWDQNKTDIAKPGPIIKLSTDYDRKVKVAKKINKYLRKKIEQINSQNKASKDWLKTAGYLDTKDQDKINYIFVPLKKVKINKIPGDAGHFIRTEIDSTDFKKENLATKIRRNKNIRKPYKEMVDNNNADKDETIQILDDIAVLEPGKNAQIAAKKISEKYKLIT